MNEMNTFTYNISGRVLFRMLYVQTCCSELDKIWCFGVNKGSEFNLGSHSFNLIPGVGLHEAQIEI
jgi:hypothetical protein